MQKDSKVKATADLIVELDKEVEASSHTATQAESVQRAREVLRQWVDGVQGVVVNPAFGRVTVIDQNGNAATIASAALTYDLVAAGITNMS